ncbi:MAG: HIT family hydrolase [Opitutae bacterium]|nr:HIT family hydrolase [Opitutae bacterium]|tara:strand:+ start:3596 stop:4093 length:498 start_codon:yes stop_codon:yes gene_type:complete
MDNLHAYWRMEYVSAPKKEREEVNPFATIPNLGDDRKALLIHRSTHCYLVLNKFPYNAGHLLVAPYREVALLTDLTKEERTDFMNMIIFAQDLLVRALRPDGFNVGMNLGADAGAGIPSHLHCHVVPRWKADVNFMPVIAKTRVLPEALDVMWSKLSEHLAEMTV